MNKYTFDFELQTMSTMLMNAFSDIVIKRYNVHKEARDQIKTRIVYAPKQRVLNDLLDRDQNLQLPVISVQIAGLARDDNRVFNKLLGTFHTNPNNTFSLNEKSPLPVDVTYNISILGRYQQDIDQILSHLLPYINPYFVISWRTPSRPEFEIRSTVLWNGAVNIQYPIDVAANQVARVVADLSFVFKGWLFQNRETVENIFTFNSTYVNTGTLSIPDEFVLDSSQYRNIENSDHIIYHAAPPKPKVIEPFTTQVGVIQQFNAWGTGFEHVKNVYLSGAPLAYISTTQDPFSGFSTLSSDYLPFTAVKLLTSEWYSDGNTFLTFVMPSADGSGLIDLIVENAAGYGKLTEGVNINTFNPFASSNPAYYSFSPYQMPFLSGVQVF